VSYFVSQVCWEAADLYINRLHWKSCKQFFVWLSVPPQTTIPLLQTQALFSGTGQRGSGFRWFYTWITAGAVWRRRRKKERQKGFKYPLTDALFPSLVWTTHTVSTWQAPLSCRCCWWWLIASLCPWPPTRQTRCYKQRYHTAIKAWLLRFLLSDGYCFVFYLCHFMNAIAQNVILTWNTFAVLLFLRPTYSMPTKPKYHPSC